MIMAHINMIYIILVGFLSLTRCGCVTGDETEHLRERIRSLETALQRSKAELTTCHRKLESRKESIVGQAWTSLGSCFASPPDKPFKPFVSELLRKLELEQGSSLAGEQSRTLVFSSSSIDVQTLRRFVLYDDVKFSEVQEIILESLNREVERKEDWWSFVQKDVGNRIHPSVVIFCMAGLVSCVVLVPLLLGAKKRLIFIVLLCYCIVHTWLGEYWKAVAKKEAILAKHGPTMKNCRLEKKGLVGSLTDFFSGLFNGKEDPCEEYYRASLVDPAFEVNLLHAFVESITQLLGVLGGLGQGLGHFVTNFLAPIPLVWKIPGLAAGIILILVLSFVFSGYQFKTWLFSIGPSRSETRKIGRKKKPAVTATDGETSDEEGRVKKPVKSSVPLPYPVDDDNPGLHSLLHLPADRRPQYTKHQSN